MYIFDKQLNSKFLLVLLVLSRKLKTFLDETRLPIKNIDTTLSFITFLTKNGNLKAINLNFFLNGRKQNIF